MYSSVEKVENCNDTARGDWIDMIRNKRAKSRI